MFLVWMASSLKISFPPHINFLFIDVYLLCPDNLTHNSLSKGLDGFVVTLRSSGLLVLAFFALAYKNILKEANPINLALDLALLLAMLSRNRFGIHQSSVGLVNPGATTDSQKLMRVGQTASQGYKCADFLSYHLCTFPTIR